MRGYRCPGQSGRNLEAELYPCPGCGWEVEIFSDELRAKCPRCGKEVYGKKTPSCVDWCGAAEQCLGLDVWKQLKGREEGNSESFSCPFLPILEKRICLEYRSRSILFPFTP